MQRHLQGGGAGGASEDGWKTKHAGRSVPLENILGSSGLSPSGQQEELQSNIRRKSWDNSCVLPLLYRPGQQPAQMEEEWTPVWGTTWRRIKLGSDGASNRIEFMENYTERCGKNFNGHKELFKNEETKRLLFLKAGKSDHGS